MLHRNTGRGVLLITQPAHAWISGQMARQWASDLFSACREEVCLATAQHDIGFLPWEQTPSFNPATGRPHSFLELPLNLHLEIWSRGIGQMLGFGRYPALLVSLHFTLLAERHHNGRTVNEQRMVDRFISEQRTFQSDLLNLLRDDPLYRQIIASGAVQTHQHLLAAWDWISLLLCHGFTGCERINNVPLKQPRSTLQITALDSALSFSVDPWPFMSPELHLRCEGRLLQGTFADEQSMRNELSHCAPETLKLHLTPV